VREKHLTIRRATNARQMNVWLREEEGHMERKLRHNHPGQHGDQPTLSPAKTEGKPGEQQERDRRDPEARAGGTTHQVGDQGQADRGCGERDSSSEASRASVHRPTHAHGHQACHVTSGSRHTPRTVGNPSVDHPDDEDTG
jgi:hypothetical protein